MNLLLQDYQCDIVFSENQINVLIIENPDCFTNILHNLWIQINGGDGTLILAEREKNLSISKYVDLIFNPFALTVNNKRVITSIHKQLITDAYESLQSDTLVLNSQLLEYIDSLIQCSPYPLIYDEQTGLAELLKIYDIRIDDHFANLAEATLNYLCIMNSVAGIKLFVFVNMKQYFSNEDLVQIYEKLFYEKIIVLDIESVQKNCLKYEHLTIIDKDRCIINI